MRTPAGHPVHENFRVHAFRQVPLLALLLALLPPPPLLLLLVPPVQLLLRPLYTRLVGSAPCASVQACADFGM